MSDAGDVGNERSALTRVRPGGGDLLELVLPKLPMAPPAGGVAADDVATGGVADNGVPKLGNLKAAGETVFVAGRPGARESGAVADGDPTMVGALKTRIQSNNSKNDTLKNTNYNNGSSS